MRPGFVRTSPLGSSALSPLALLLAALLLCACGGCVTREPARPSNWVENFRRCGYSNASNVARLEVAPLEVHVGDRFLNIDVWEHADPWVIASEIEELDLTRKELLEKNGFRIGQIVETMPAKLTRLLTSKRTCIDPKILVRPMGQTVPLVLSASKQDCHYQLHLPTGATDHELPQAQCSFLVTTEPTKDGKTKLTFTPRVAYGEDLPRFYPKQDQADQVLNWSLKHEPQYETLSKLKFSIVVAANGLVLLGADLQKPNSLGFQFFVDRLARPPVQRFLVLRVCRSGVTGIDAQIPTLPEASQPRFREPVPLASQVGRTTVRANRP